MIVGRFNLVWALGAAAVALLAPSLYAAEVAGRVTNGTTGKPVPGQFVNLMALRGQMEPVAETETDAQGRFRFALAANPNERYMVQVPYRGVLYSRPAMFAGGETVTADIEVFEVGARPQDIRVETHTIFLEPHRGHLRVNEYYELSNTSRPPRTYYPEGGGFRFSLPAGADDLEISAGRAGAPSLRQQPQPVEAETSYALDFALRPGNSEIQVSYAVPMSGETLELKLPLRAAAARRHLVIPKEGVRVEAAGLSDFPQTQAPQARVYAVGLQSPGELSVRVTVDPAALEAAAAAAAREQPAAGGEGQVEIVPHPVNRAQWYIVGLSLFVLLLGLYYLSSLQPAPAATDGNRLEPDRHSPRRDTASG